MTDSSIRTPGFTFERNVTEDKNLLPDRATAEAVLALCQLVQLRDAYNGDWVLNWDDEEQEWYFAVIITNEIAEFVSGENVEDCMRKRSELLLELEEASYEIIQKDPIAGEENEF